MVVHLPKQAEEALPPNEFEYAQALAAALADESKVAALEQYEQWRSVEPKPVNP